jgi:hypothetical protein
MRKILENKIVIITGSSKKINDIEIRKRINYE